MNESKNKLKSTFSLTIVDFFFGFTLVLSSHLSCQKTLMYLFQSGGLAKRLVGKFSVELALSPPVSQAAAAISQTPPSRLCPPLHCTAGRVVLFALHTNVTLALCYAGFLSFVLLEDNRILKQDEKDHLSCLADSKPLFVVASPTSCRQGKPTVSQLRGRRGHQAGPVRLYYCR